MLKKFLPWQARKAMLAGTVCFLLFLAGCLGKTATEEPVPRTTGLSPSGVLVSLFVNFPEKTMTGIWVRFSSVALVSGEGVQPLQLLRQEFDTRDLAGGQRLLARGGVEPGGYHALRLSLEKAALAREGGRVFLSLSDPVVDLPLPQEFQLENDSSLCLFLEWREQGAISGKAFFAPRLSVYPQKEPFLADLAYASCPDLDTVFTFRTDRNWVTGSFRVSGHPTRMAYIASNRQLLVLASGSSEIVKVRATSSQITDRLKIPLTNRPSFMVSPDGDWAYVLDTAADNLIRMSLADGTLSGRARVGHRPAYLDWLADSGKLAVSSELSQQVFVLDPETLSEVTVLAVGGSPGGLDGEDGQLYVTEGNTNILGVYSQSDWRETRRVRVGIGPRRVLAAGEKVYVSNFKGRSLSLLLARQQRMAREIPLEGKPLELAASSNQQWLYAVQTDPDRVAVVDQTANRAAGFLEFGCPVEDIVMVP